jgi:hypothetical protein
MNNYKIKVRVENQEKESWFSARNGIEAVKFAKEMFAVLLNKAVKDVKVVNIITL